jgi:hypothetical protein
LAANTHLWAPGALARPNELETVTLFDQNGQEHVLSLHPQELEEKKSTSELADLFLVRWRASMFGVRNDILTHLEGFVDFSPANNQALLNADGTLTIPRFIKGSGHKFFLTDVDGEVHCVPWFPNSGTGSQEELTSFTAKLAAALLPGVNLGPCPGGTHGAAFYLAESARVRRYAGFVPTEPTIRASPAYKTFIWGAKAKENRTFKESDNTHLFVSPGVLAVPPAEGFTGVFLTDTNGQQILLKQAKAIDIRQWVKLTLKKHIFPSAEVGPRNSIGMGIIHGTNTHAITDLPRNIQVAIPPSLAYKPPVGEIWRVRARGVIRPVSGHQNVSLPTPDGKDFSTHWRVCQGAVLRPIYVMMDFPESFEDAWKEWSEGIRGQPPVAALEYRYGPTWRQGTGPSGWFHSRWSF